jgi:putative endonuclease
LDGNCYVYILKARDRNGRLITYVGWTLDLGRRLDEHNGKGQGAKTKGAKSTRGRAWALVYAEKHASKRAAMAREYALKQDRVFRAELRSRG